MAWRGRCVESIGVLDEKGRKEGRGACRPCQSGRVDPRRRRADRIRGLHQKARLHSRAGNAIVTHGVRSAREDPAPRSAPQRELHPPGGQIRWFRRLRPTARPGVIRSGIPARRRPRAQRPKAPGTMWGTVISRAWSSTGQGYVKRRIGWGKSTAAGGRFRALDALSRRPAHPGWIRRGRRVPVATRPSRSRSSPGNPPRSRAHPPPPRHRGPGAAGKHRRAGTSVPSRRP